MMRRRLPGPGTLFAASLVLLLVVACGAAATVTPAPTATSAPQATPAPGVAGATSTPVATAQPNPSPQAGLQGKYGGVLSLHDYAFPNIQFHPHFSRNEIKNVGPVYNSVIEFNPETDERNDLRGDLATSWELSPDGKTYVFRLNENARWHDGTPVTAEDIVYSLDSMVNPDTPRPLAVPVMVAYYQRGTARAIDEYTVEVPLKVPAADFLPTLAIDRLKVLAKHWVEPALADPARGIDWVDKWENAMGSGPYKPAELVKDISIELEKNPDYWKEGRPYLDGLKYFTIGDKGTAMAAYRTGQVLVSAFPFTGLSNREALQLQEQARDVLTVHFVPSNLWHGLLMNATRAPFDDPRVRQALNLVIHRQPIVQLAGAPEVDTIGPALAVGHFFSRSPEEIATLPGYRELDGEKHPDDIAAAKELLAAVGVPEGFEVTLTARTVGYVEPAQVVAEQLRNFLGWEVTVEPVDSATGFLRYNKHDYQLAYQANNMDVPTPDIQVSKSWIEEGVFTEWSGWTPPDSLVDLYARQSAELDKQKRLALLRQIEDYLINEDPGSAVPLFWAAAHTIVNNRIKNFHSINSITTQLKWEHVWCDPEC